MLSVLSVLLTACHAICRVGCGWLAGEEHRYLSGCLCSLQPTVVPGLVAVVVQYPARLETELHFAVVVVVGQPI